MNIYINQISTKEIQLSVDGLKEQINWNMAHKNFALVLALQAGCAVLEAELAARALPDPVYNPDL